ncbi:MAG: acyl-CoA thioesterase [Brumimicrobium sp.]|nr:acyl-CoA thioesterase [Brumimicrobium sp.]
MNIQERIVQAQTSLFKVVFPNTTNHHDTLFGGNAMQLMDEIAFITATRFSRKKMVTVSSSQIDFTEPIPANTIIELNGKVKKVGNTSLQIEVTVYQEEMYDASSRKKSIEGLFTLVAIDVNKRPIPIL